MHKHTDGWHKWLCTPRHTEINSLMLNFHESRQRRLSISLQWFIYLLLAITKDIVSAPPINPCYFPQHGDLESRGSQRKWRWWSTISTFPWETCTAVSKREEGCERERHYVDPLQNGQVRGRSLSANHGIDNPSHSTSLSSSVWNTLIHRDTHTHT